MEPCIYPYCTGAQKKTQITAFNFSTFQLFNLLLHSRLENVGFHLTPLLKGIGDPMKPPKKFRPTLIVRLCEWVVDRYYSGRFSVSKIDSAILKLHSAADDMIHAGGKDPFYFAMEIRTLAYKIHDNSKPKR
jgi:hypothetical protein